MGKRAICLSLLMLTCVGAHVAGAAETAIRAHYKDDFILESPEGNFQLKIRGNVHLDLRGYQAEERGAPYSFDMRRGRIDLQGTIHKIFTFRVQPELVGKPYLRNAWVDAGPWPWLHVRAGQMKVPFSTSWVTLDNNVNFVERGSSTPVYPFFDRGVLLWGELWKGRIVYNLGAFTGAGIDVDYGSGDVDDSKDLAARLYLRPFLGTGRRALEGLVLVGQTTWGGMSVPTSRFETGGLRSANYETAIWRWRTEQTLGTDGRVTDRVRAEVDSRLRWGAELHYLLGPVAFSGEYLEVRYEGIALYHDLMEGSSRRAHDALYQQDGTIRSLSVWVSGYVTGEHKQVSNFGWKTAKPKRPVGEGGLGALEVLARYSRTWTDKHLFEQSSVAGFAPGSASLPSGYSAATPGAANTVKVSVLDGAHDVHELTLGVSWTVNPMVRLQLNEVFQWAPASDRDGDGNSDNKLVSGAKSDQSDVERKNIKTSWENAVMARLIFKL
jgi:phosphate-selective porin